MSGLLDDLRRFDGPLYLGRGRHYDPHGVGYAALGYPSEPPPIGGRWFDPDATTPEPVLTARTLYLERAAERRPEIIAVLRSHVMPFYVAHLHYQRDCRVSFPRRDPMWGLDYALLLWLNWSGLSAVNFHPFKAPDEFGQRAMDRAMATMCGWRSREFQPDAQGFGPGFLMRQLKPSDEPDRGWSDREAEARGLKPTPRLNRDERLGGPLRHLEWLVERRVLGWMPKRIAQHHGVSVAAVAQALKREARRLGMDPLARGRRTR